jgi:hypothetical protein
MTMHLTLEQRLKVFKMAHSVCTGDHRLEMQELPESLTGIPDLIITTYEKFVGALEKTEAVEIDQSWHEKLDALEAHYKTSTIAAEKIGINRTIFWRIRQRSVIPVCYYSKIDRAYRKIAGKESSESEGAGSKRSKERAGRSGS